MSIPKEAQELAKFRGECAKYFKAQRSPMPNQLLNRPNPGRFTGWARNAAKMILEDEEARNRG